jgi:hypothetical protein
VRPNASHRELRLLLLAAVHLDLGVRHRRGDDCGAARTRASARVRALCLRTRRHTSEHKHKHTHTHTCACRASTSARRAHVGTDPDPRGGRAPPSTNLDTRHGKRRPLNHRCTNKTAQ